MDFVRIIIILVFLIVVVGVLLLVRRTQIPARIRKAEEYLENDDYVMASSIVKEILEKKKDYIPARYLRARILIKQKQYLLAISELNGILALPEFKGYVKEVDIHYKLAELYAETKQWVKEIEEYKIILSFNPEDVKANHRVGHTLYKQKRYKEAKTHLSKALDLNPTLSDCHLPLGVSSYHLSEFTEAEEAFLNVLRKSQFSPEANYYLGLIYKGKKDYDAALKMFDNSKRDNKFYIKSVFALGSIYFEKGEYKKAIEILESGANSLKKGKDDDSLAYRYLLAECYEMENRIYDAIGQWEQIEKVNPSYRSTKLKLSDYNIILNNENLKTLFTSSLDELQPLIYEIISRLNYNIVSQKEVSTNEYMYKAYNIKRINEPPVLIYFNRTTREITEGQILEFQKKVVSEKCRSGIYLTTSKYSIKAKTAASSKMIELLESSFLIKSIEKIGEKMRRRT
jgi:tetratricopeptide (TPR) repeat protein